jgi:hypothetical protein
MREFERLTVTPAQQPKDSQEKNQAFRVLHRNFICAPYPSSAAPCPPARHLPCHLRDTWARKVR